MLLLVVLALASGAVVRGEITNACGVLTLNEIVYGGLERQFYLYVPCSIWNGAQVNIGVFVHGYGSSAKEMLEQFGAQSLAEKHKYIALAPDGYGAQKSWNGVDCCGEALLEQLDDKGLLGAIISKVTVSLHKFYVINAVVGVGHSNGGFLVTYAGGDVFDAVVPASGYYYRANSPAPNIPMMVVHSLDDTLVKYIGCCRGSGCCCDIKTPSCISAMNYAIKVAKANGCDSVLSNAKSVLSVPGKGFCKEFQGCGENKATTTLCTLTSYGHFPFALAEGKRENHFSDAAAGFIASARNVRNLTKAEPADKNLNQSTGPRPLPKFMVLLATVAAVAWCCTAARERRQRELFRL